MLIGVKVAETVAPVDWALHAADAPRSSDRETSKRLSVDIETTNDLKTAAAKVVQRGELARENLTGIGSDYCIPLVP